LIHGFAPPGLASNHRGWGQFIHTQFLPGGRRASLRPFQSADRHTPIATQRPPPGGFFFWACARQTKLSASQQKFRERFTTEQLGFVSAWRCRARGTPDEEPAPLRRGFCIGGPRHPTPGPLLVGHRLAAWRNDSPRSQGYCCSKSSVRFRFSARREIVLTVRGDTSFCSIRGRLRTTAMIDTVTMVLALMSGSIFLAHALDGLRSRA
jgi:hypothetical protein